MKTCFPPWRYLEALRAIHRIANLVEACRHTCPVCVDRSLDEVDLIHTQEHLAGLATFLQEILLCCALKQRRATNGGASASAFRIHYTGVSETTKETAN
eukprot:scaffold49765_cov15-Tisochrysis_lutea.AAC.2